MGVETFPICFNKLHRSRVDVIGDYGGTELFLIEGDSLIQECVTRKTSHFNLSEGEVCLIHKLKPQIGSCVSSASTSRWNFSCKALGSQCCLADCLFRNKQTLLCLQSAATTLFASTCHVPSWSYSSTAGALFWKFLCRRLDRVPSQLSPYLHIYLWSGFSALFWLRRI